MMKPGGVMVSASPGREKLPTPPGLARLLYGKAGCTRSRGRSTSSSAARSSPMLVSRSRSLGRSSSAVAAAATEEGEPSSPKVTCMGQVRMRNKMSAAKPKKPQSKKAGSKSSLMPFRCFHQALLCSLLPARKRRTGGGSDGGGRRSLWRGWACIRSGGSEGCQQRKRDAVRPPPPPEFIGSGKVLDREEDRGNEDEDEEEEAHEEEEAGVLVPSATATPPKNALLLMRCRSAPHNRASSLATVRFAVSPLPEPAPPEDVGEGKARNEEDQQQQEADHVRSSVGGVLTQVAEEEEDDEARGSESRRPLVLPRSKSEPAGRAAAKLAVPEPSYCFWASNSGSRSRSIRSSPVVDV